MIILSSSSPRRHEILNEFNIEHLVIPSSANEISDFKINPKEVCETNSRLKAEFLINDYPNDIIIGADTIVVINNEILGKPKDKDDAVRMLNLLSSNTHEVISGVTIIKQGNINTFSVTSKVTLNKLSNDDILNYINNDYVYDKAGSYAIQSPYFKPYIKNVEGSYYNIVGLPIEKLIEELKKY